MVAQPIMTKCGHSRDGLLALNPTKTEMRCHLVQKVSGD